MRVAAVARNTFREAVRDKVFSLVGAFGLVLILSSIIMSPLTIGAQHKIVADVGLSSISIFSLLVILFLGSGLVHKEIDKRTIMTLLSKPLSRGEFLLGKYLGLVSTLLVMMLAMSALFLLSLLLTRSPIKASYFVSLLLSLSEMMVLTGVLLFFSSFTTPVLTSLFTLGVFVVGRTVEDLEAFAIVTDNAAAERIAVALRFVLPNLDLFNVRNASIHDLPIAGGQVSWALIYAAVYIAALLVLAELLFRRREFK